MLGGARRDQNLGGVSNDLQCHVEMDAKKTSISLEKRNISLLGGGFKYFLIKVSAQTSYQWRPRSH